MDGILILITLILMFIGFLGAFIPGIPGVGFVYLVLLLYSILTGFDIISLKWVIGLGLLTLLGLISNYLVTLMTSKKAGASKYGLIGAILGGILGLIFLNVIGLIIGQVLGAIAGEFLVGRETKPALKVGIATFIGYVLSMVVESTIAIIIIVVYSIKVIN